MSELDRTAWAKEAARIEKQINHRRKRLADLQGEVDDLERTRTALIKKISDDYIEEHG